MSERRRPTMRVNTSPAVVGRTTAAQRVDRIGGPVPKADKVRVIGYRDANGRLERSYMEARLERLPELKATYERSKAVAKKTRSFTRWHEASKEADKSARIILDIVDEAEEYLSYSANRG